MRNISFEQTKGLLYGHRLLHPDVAEPICQSKIGPQFRKLYADFNYKADEYPMMFYVDVDGYRLRLYKIDAYQAQQFILDNSSTYSEYLDLCGKAKISTYVGP